MKINCIIVDDAPLAIEKLRGFVGKLPGLNLLSAFSNGIEAVGFLHSHSVDLLFLDIEMEGFSGLQVLDSLKTRPCVIITSAYDEYAVKGYEYDVADYLLKPFSFERFAQAVDKAASVLERREPVSGFMFVKTEYRVERVDFQDILYIEGMREYLQIVTADRKIMTLQSFAGMEKTLPPNGFVRVHRSYIVAVSKIDSIERGVIRIGEKRIPVGQSYRSALEKILNGI